MSNKTAHAKTLMLHLTFLKLVVCCICTLDASTIKNLELIQNARDPESGHCLYGVLNHTKTAGGGSSNSLSPRLVLY